MVKNNVVDVTIIGGGVAGLFAAFYSGLRDMSTKLIEASTELGGKMRGYPEKMVWDVGGVPPITGARFIEQSIDQGMTFNPEVVMNEKIIKIEKRPDHIFELEAESGEIHYSKTIVIAVGSGILDPKKLQIKGKEVESSNIHYTIQSLKYFKDKRIIISGGGNTAIDWANELEQVSKEIYLTFRKEALTGHEAMIKKALSSSVTFLPESIITNIYTENNAVNMVEITNQTTEVSSTMLVDHVIINHGYHRDTSLLKNSHPSIRLLHDLYVEGNVHCETSVAGLYAAGDVLRYTGKLELILGAYQDATNAVNKAKHYIQPNAREIAMVSTHNDMFKNRNRTLVEKLLNE